MIFSGPFPSFDSHLPELHRFTLRLAEAYQADTIRTWEDFEGRVDTFFTSERMATVESIVPGWRKMASYLEGLTRTHVMGVFLGLILLPEFRALSQEQQQLAKWIVLFHDVEKEVKQGRRDPKHGFRSAVIAARQLPQLGFTATEKYDRLIDPWSEFTYTAVKKSEPYPEPIQDNEKLPEILAGIEELFGDGSPAGLIVKGVLLHMSINLVRDWLQAAPLTEEEIKQHVTYDLAPLLKVTMLADNDGWVLFYPEREQQRADILETFQRIERMISH